jgi:hypothetical protein
MNEYRDQSLEVITFPYGPRSSAGCCSQVPSRCWPTWNNNEDQEFQVSTGSPPAGPSLRPMARRTDDRRQRLRQVARVNLPERAPAAERGESEDTRSAHASCATDAAAVGSVTKASD